MLRRSAPPLISMVAGAITSVVPLVLLKFFAATVDTGQAAVVATLLAACGMIAQLLSARLIDVQLLPGNAAPRLSVPWSLHLATIVALIVSGLGLFEFWLGVLGVLAIVILLEVSRQMSVLHAGARKDLVVIVLASSGITALELTTSWLMLWTVLPTFLASAILVRLGRPTPERLTRVGADGRWVLLETATTSLTQPAVTSLTLLLAGPLATVVFRLVNGVVNTFGPALVFIRVRLLRNSSRADLTLVTVVLSALSVTVMVLHVTGVWLVLLGPAWSSVTILTVGAALTWRFSTLFSTVPFTELRRAGKVTQVFKLRLSSTVLYLTCSLGAVTLLRSAGSVFGAFAVAELLTAALYWRAVWKLRSESLYPQLEESAN